jgi:hypothetical protein
MRSNSRPGAAQTIQLPLPALRPSLERRLQKFSFGFAENVARPEIPLFKKTVVPVVPSFPISLVN